MRKLLITSTDLMMIQFLVPHVTYLSENGFHVELACSEVGGRMAEVREALGHAAKSIHTVRLERSPANPRNLLGYADMRRLLQENQYDIIWTNEPVMGVVTRLAARDARRSGTQVVYMCHGFHFFKGASKLNWLVFYPIERFMSRFCDCIVTMNEEDYQRASTFHALNVHKIPGVGVDFSRFVNDVTPEQRKLKREELGVSENAFFLLSVGELTHRKNHEVVLRALHQLQDPNIRYIICGKGKLQPKLETMVQQLGLTGQVSFPGYRMDLSIIYHCADCFIFPSLQEGLPFALMEAMSSGLPILCSRIRGNVDLIDDPQGGILCDANNADQFCEALKRITSFDPQTLADYNRKKLKTFSLENTKVLLADLLNQLNP